MTLRVAARTAPAVRSGKRPGKTRRGCHRGVDTYRPREAGRQNSRSEMRDTRCMSDSDRVTGPFPWVGRASTKVALFRGRTARSQTPRAGRRYRAYLVPCRFWCALMMAWCAALGPRTWFASHFFNGGQRQKIGNLQYTHTQGQTGRTGTVIVNFASGGSDSESEPESAAECLRVGQIVELTRTTSSRSTKTGMPKGQRN